MNQPALRLAALLALPLAPLTAPAADLDCRFTVRHRANVDAAGAARVEILVGAGDLTVRPSAGGALVAEGRACASSQELLDQIQLRAKREGDVLRVYAQLPGEMQGIGLFYASLDLVVSVPGDLPVDVTDSSGDVTLDRVRVTRLRDLSGDVVARGVRGDLEIEDSSGDLRFEDAAGQLTISDSSGDIVVRGAAGVHVVVDSSGDIDVERVSGGVLVDRDSSGDIRIAGVGGDVEVLADSSGKVRVSDAKGTVRVP
jgi:hypothetical protein